MMRMIRAGDHNLWFIESRISAHNNSSHVTSQGSDWKNQRGWIKQKSCVIIIIITRCSWCAQSISSESTSSSNRHENTQFSHLLPPATVASNRMHRCSIHPTTFVKALGRNDSIRFCNTSLYSLFHIRVIIVCLFTPLHWRWKIVINCPNLICLAFV